MATHPFPDAMQAPETGIAEIDDEWRHMLAQLPRIEAVCARFAEASDCADCDALQAGCAEALLDAAGELMEFLYAHVTEEERLMKRTGFVHAQRERYASHVKDHADLTEELATIIVQLKSVPTVHAARRLHRLMCSWLDDHVLRHDLFFARSTAVSG